MIGAPESSSPIKWRVWAAGAAVVIFAAALRFYALNWDSTALLDANPGVGFHEPGMTHPDEREILVAVSKLSSENWNPHFFAYGSLPMYLIKIASLVASLGGPQWTDQAHTLLVGRFISALFGVATVLATFRLGWRMFGAGAGVLGAAFLAAAVLHVQMSHFATTDIHVGLFAVLALLASLEIVRRGGMSASIAAGAFWGLGTACKFNGVTIVGVVLAAHAVRAFEIRQGAAAERPGAWARNLALSLVAGLVAFSLTQPYAWLDARACWEWIFNERDMVTGKTLRPYVQQYIHTPKIAYQTEFIVRWGMGPALGLAAFVAFAWAIVRSAPALLGMAREAAAPAARRGSTGSAEVYAILLLLAYLIPNFLLVGLFQVKFPRYLIALYPMWCLLAAHLFVRLGRAGGAKSAAAWGAAVPVCVATAVWLAAFMRIYASPHTYVRATRWAYDNLPAETRIVTEDWNEEVPMYLGGGKFVMGDPLKLHVYDLPDDANKAQSLGSVLASGEYVCLGSSTLWATLVRLDNPDPRWPNNRYPVMSAFYRLLFDGKLGYEKVREFTNYPRIFGIEFNDDAVDLGDPDYRYRCDQSFSFYDHPKVVFFRRVEALGPDEIARRIVEAAEVGGGESTR